MARRTRAAIFAPSRGADEMLTLADLCRELKIQVTVTAVLGVSPRSFPRVRVDGGGARLRLCALHVMGHGSARLARATGASERTTRALVDGDARTVSIRLRDTLIAVYDRWWDKRAPDRTRAERAGRPRGTPPRRRG